jgi:hypothetical protein
LLEQLKVPKKLIQVLQEVVVPEQELTEDEMESLLEKVFLDPSIGKQHRTRIIEAAAIASYHKETGMPMQKLMAKRSPRVWLLGRDSNPRLSG